MKDLSSSSSLWSGKIIDVCVHYINVIYVTSMFYIVSL